MKWIYTACPASSKYSKAHSSQVDLKKCSKASSPTSDDVHGKAVSLAVAVKIMSHKGVYVMSIQSIWDLNSEGCSVGCILEPHCERPLNVRQWSFEALQHGCH